MRLTNKQAAQLRLRGVAFLAGIAVLIGLITMREPMTAYAVTDPGLDSGNAVVDRTSVAGQTILKYQTSGTSTFKAPAGVSNVRVLVVGGGGGGGAGELNSGGDGGGGGGAGEYRNETSLTTTPGQALTVTVGGGGTGSTTKQADGGTTAQNGTNGANSVFGSLTARGGGGGGGNDQHGLNGGSGGGAGGHCTSSSTSGGTKTAVAPGVGNNGGSSPAGSCSPRGAAGGGGAGAVGTNGSGNTGGTGAIGLQNDITGANAFYAAGGGGGGGSNSTGANGGSSVGGNGGSAGATGGSGTVGAANTGSGGGGGGATNSSSGGNGGNGGSGIVIVRFTTQNIPDAMGMTGLRMWYKADATGNTNALWKDSSGFSYDMSQATGSKQPVLTTNALNFNPGYVFDGGDDAFSMPNHGILGNEGMTAFYAANSTRTDGGYRNFEEFGDDTPSITLNNGKPDLYVRGTSPIQLTYPTAQALSPHVYSFISPNANNQSRIVGVDDNEQSQNVTSGTYTTSSGGQAGNMFGNTNGSSGTGFAGPIAEAIYFNRVLTPTERLKVISYLSIKYGITRYQGASGMGYADSNGTTIWNADATYKNNIAGIGRDDTTTLNQKQSKSSADGDIVTIGHGTIAGSNAANSNNFTADRSFLLWGHNAAATNTTTTVTGAYNRMNRIWKAVGTGTVGQVKIQVPTSAVPGGNGILYTSSSTTFDGSATRTNMTVNGSNYEATVTIPAGTSYFSFGSIAGSDIQFVSKSATDPGGTPLTTYTPGESIEYKLTVKNNGPDNAGTVTVTDTLPTGIVPKANGATGGGWNCNVSSQTVTCTRPALNSGVTAPDITIEANIASNVTGSKLNTATASVSNDPDNTNNSASLTLPAAPHADLSITKSHTGVPVAGQPHTYKFTVINNGPSDVGSFTVTDPLDSKMSLASSTGSICSPVGGAQGQTITCTGGALTANGPGNTTTFDMIVNVAGDYGGGVISNTGTVAVPAGTTDPVPGNNSSTDQSNVLVDTQVGVAKTHTGNFTAGVNNTFTITVDNQGPSTSPIGSITVTDTLDEDFAYVSAVGTGWSCTPDTSTFTCTNTVTMTAGATSDITLTVLVDSIADGTTSNTAEVSTTTPDTDLTDNSSTNPVTIESSADLALTKGHIGGAFVAGQTEQYTFSVTNNGPSADSPSYTITDTLPTGVTFVSTDPSSAANCTGASGNTVVNCTGGAIGAGAPAQVTTINVAVGGGLTAPLDNSATVTVAAGVTDPNLTNNTGTDNNVPIEPNADLSITKTPTTDMTAGATAQYTIGVHNNGPSNVASFTVTDTLDSNLTFQASTGCSVTSTTGDGRQVVTCTGGAVNSGQDATAITLNVLVEATATPGSTISNTAIVATPTGVNDPTPGNNSSSVDRNVVASADLEITKSHTGNFTAGSTSNTYTIVVTNNGPSDATTFTVTDVLPTGITFVSGASTAGVNASCINAGQTVTCTGGPAIGAGQSSTITLTVAVDANIAGGSTRDNTASVASATPDPDTSNNTSTVDTVTIDSKADLAITKSNGSDFTAGSDEDYTIGVVNNGPSDVSGFTVTDTLPAGLTFVSTGSDPGCSAIGQAVTCNGGALASGATTSLTIRVHTDSGLSAGTVINNTAEVATIAPTTDPATGNNSATDPTTVVNITDFSIQKGHVGTFVAGQTGQYTFTVSNGGPSASPTSDVQVNDTLPEGMTFASGTGTGWSCTGSVGRDVTCIYAPSLAVSGTTSTLTVTVNIAPDKQGEVTNTGMGVSTLDDSDPSDDTDSDTTTIAAQANLTATKVRQGSGDLTAGQSITYRFTVENDGGPSQANNVTITDNLQGDFIYQSFNSVSGGTWDCSESGGTVTCTMPSLGVDATAVVDVTLKIAEDAPNPLANTAAVTFNGTDPSPANPSASDPLTYLADLEVDITHEQKTYRAGDTVVFDFTITNHGPSAAKDVVMTANIPNGLTIEGVTADAPGGGSILGALDRLLFPRVHAASNPFTCHLSGSQLICNANPLFVGTYHLFVTGKISSNFTGQMVLSASITSSTPDPNPNDTSATDMLVDVLAATGQNIWLWVGGALVMITAAAVLFTRLRRNHYHGT